MRGGSDRDRLRGWPLKKEEGGGLVVLLLAERARSECARSTRALEDRPGCPPRGRREGLEEEGMKADDLLCSRNAPGLVSLVRWSFWSIWFFW
jgi:hypothetical protein